MSCTMHQLQFACTTADLAEMTERELGRSGLPDDVRAESAEDWAIENLTRVMTEAGQAFIDAHSGLFKVGLT